MASISTPAQLAAALAQTAREIAVDCGDLAAQLAVYGIFLERLGDDARVDKTRLPPIDARVREQAEQILRKADIDGIRSTYAADGRDPAVYFHEDFLRAYDPANARRRGVHYSPPGVVAYMFRAVQSILKRQFGESLSDAVVLDPCCGAGTFLRYIRDHCQDCPRLIGMELMPAAHMIASALLGGSAILNVDGLGESALDIEGGTLVVIGNPPYSGHSANAGKIAHLLADYRPGGRERNPKWLQDDYVKFLRMAQHRVTTAGRGIVAFVTNHSYLTNPTFRTMRESVARDFDEVYLLDLHGNAKRSENLLDENVFPIQMGVAITLLVRNGRGKGCSIRYAELRGSRESKLQTLSETSFEDTPWKDVDAGSPFHLFVPHSTDLAGEYARFAQLSQIFHTSSVGFVTSRDSFAVAFDRDELRQRISDLRDDRISPEVIRERYPVGDLDIAAARRALQEDARWEEKLVRVLYRPFDYRWAYYSARVMERPRLPFMLNLMRENTALAIGRAGQATGSDEWDVVFCTDRPADLNLFRRGGALLLPRLVYGASGRLSNMRPHGVDGDNLFSYIYAVLHSTVYRARYADFLRVDFPRIPLPKDDRLIHALAALGEELLAVHLLKDRRPTHSTTPRTSLKIGGYELPRRFAEARRHRALTEDEEAHLGRIHLALERTAEIRRRIDEVVRDSPPWA